MGHVGCCGQRRESDTYKPAGVQWAGEAVALVVRHAAEAIEAGQARRVDDARSVPSGPVLAHRGPERTGILVLADLDTEGRSL